MEKLQSKMYHVLFCGRIIWVCGLQSPYVTRACIDDWLTRSSPKAKTEPHMAVLLRHSTCHCDGSPPPGTTLCWFKSRGKVCVVGAGAQIQKRRQLGRTSKRWRGVGGFFFICMTAVGWKREGYVFSNVVFAGTTWMGSTEKRDIECGAFAKNDEWKERHIDKLTEGKRVRQIHRGIRRLKERHRRPKTNTQGERQNERESWRQLDRFLHGTRCHHTICKAWLQVLTDQSADM